VVSIDKEIKLRFRDLEKEISEQYKDIDNLAKEFDKSVMLAEEASDEILLLRAQIKETNTRINDVQLKQNKTDVDFTALTQKQQELDDMSIEFEELEDIKAPEISNLNKDIKYLQKKQIKQQKQLDKLNESDYASLTDTERLQEEITELKAHLVEKDDMDTANDRLGKMENKLMGRYDEVKKELDTIANNLDSIYALRRSFVSKEQFKNLRKEIRLLVSGLKDIQKIKDKLTKKKGNAFLNFFLEEK